MRVSNAETTVGNGSFLWSIGFVWGNKTSCFAEFTGSSIPPSAQIKDWDWGQDGVWFCHIVNGKVMTIQIVLLLYLIFRQKGQQEKIYCRNFPRETAEDLAKNSQNQVFLWGWVLLLIPHLSPFCIPVLFHYCPSYVGGVVFKLRLVHWSTDLLVTFSYYSLTFFFVQLGQQILVGAFLWTCEVFYLMLSMICVNTWHVLNFCKYP